MQYKKQTPGVHPYKKFGEELAKDQLPGLLFLFGEEQYLADWASSAVKDRYVDPVCREMDLSVLDGTVLTFDVLQACCETLPMLSEKRVVEVRDFPPLAGEKSKTFSEKDEEDLLRYLKAFPDTCILMFTGRKGDKRRKLYKTLASEGGCYDFTPLDEKLLKAFIQKRLKNSGKTASPAVLSRFIALSGYCGTEKHEDYTLYNLENDLRKLIACCDGPEIETIHVDEVVAETLEVNAFALTDALSQDRKDEAFRLLHNILSTGEEVYRLLGLVCSQLEIMLCVKEMEADGLTIGEMASRLGAHEFRVKKALQMSNRCTLKALRSNLSRAYRVDEDIKTGFLDSRLAMEMLIAEISVR
ncbi:MAG: DNA polymerase III subunit delta [Firmicutes bacterium]|nr:DNA polymerase III subunit delta [Bacillota bacterium]